MKLTEIFKQGKEALSVVGLGYVGMPIAIAFAKEGVKVVGFDINAGKIKAYQEGKDPTGEVGDETIRETKVHFTADPEALREARFHIVAVPTPVHEDHTPDLSPVISATRLLGRHLAPGSVVVYESTVYPGVTEEICVPILEKESGMTCGRDFKVGYSPERINPGDKEHRLDSIVKIVSGMDEVTLNTVAEIYGMVAKAGVFRASSIRTAEAAKVIENSQRDINIAFMNELSIIFHRMGIDTKEVLEAAKTKWNFLPFEPGLVGGHCIGVDPYYLTYKAGQLGYHSQVILSGRRINDGMGKYVAESLVKAMIRENIPVKDAKVGILGITFKENCPDTRNSKVADIIRELQEYGITPLVCDPQADAAEAGRLYGVELKPREALKELDALIVAVAHEQFKQLSETELAGFFKPSQGEQSGSRRVLFDLKGILGEYRVKGDYAYWRL